MTDTMRSVAALQALLADSAAAHSTNRQLLRDLLVSVAPTAYDIRAYGSGVGTGGDDSAAAIGTIAAALADNKNVLLPPGFTFNFGSQVVAAAPSFHKLLILGWGAEIVTSGAISGLAITGGLGASGVAVFGLKINHRGNAAATAGFDLIGACNCHLMDCTVEAHGTGASYGAAVLRNGTPANDNTGSFWNTIENFKTLMRTGGDGTAMTNGIILQGAANATRVIGGALSSTGTAILLQPENGQSTSPNAVVIDGVAFESFTTAVSSVAETTHPIGGLRVVNCRAESGTTFVSLTGATAQPGVPTFVGFNEVLPSVTTYLNNPNNLYVNTFDWSITPALNVGPILQGAKGLTVAPTTAGEHSFTAVAANNGAGFKLISSAGVDLGSWVQRQFGGTSFKGGTNLMHMSQITSIGQTTTEGKNLRGAASFAAATTVAVTFPSAEPDASYFVILGPYANKTFWVTSLTVNGFTLNASSISSDRVDWMILR